MQFDLRNGAIRKKYDSLKYTLRKMENTLYELSLAEAGFKKQEDPEGVRLWCSPCRGAHGCPCIIVLENVLLHMRHESLRPGILMRPFPLCSLLAAVLRCTAQCLNRLCSQVQRAQLSTLCLMPDAPCSL